MLPVCPGVAQAADLATRMAFGTPQLGRSLLLLDPPAAATPPPSPWQPSDQIQHNGTDLFVYSTSHSGILEHAAETAGETISPYPPIY
eukprot:scaffold52972_cov34-Prasinocladus_malaysianus.AAC.1